MPKLWTETLETHRREVRDAILDTTASLVAEHGLLGVTMSQIAEETGIGRATLYKYFPMSRRSCLPGTIGRSPRTSRTWPRSGTRPRMPASDSRPCSRHTRASRITRTVTRTAASLRRSTDRDGSLRPSGRVHQMIRDLLVAAAKSGRIRDDVPPDELASYCVHALGGAGARRSKVAVHRLVSVTMDGLRPAR